ncbi:uncharacterized protein CLUP02_04130 [Colletotrichum lupini]|uniref:Uncharacterized protein n=1 Tax=Colletotrichum lupini TaxID=145971 RepID=A0A9Q8WCG4_9PEZI|nr:uncharacterized protein CLUP02_04130 [Colletotrichum lupini]UQC78653.1 hypothetical protein CLUP02_04130 [Colletotrichum lupini]
MTKDAAIIPDSHRQPVAVRCQSFDIRSVPRFTVPKRGPLSILYGQKMSPGRCGLRDSRVIIVIVTVLAFSLPHFCWAMVPRGNRNKSAMRKGMFLILD